jgi:hypothetical protein
MIINEDIKSRELVEVLVGEPENTEYLAKVLSNEGEYLFVTYLSPIGKVYKAAPVFSFESKAERVDFESLTAHHKDIIDVEELGIKKIQPNMFVYEEDVDSESDSEIETESESDSEGSLKDFIAPDDEEITCKPCDHQEVDEAWNSWKPHSAGAQRFKQRVDEIEKYMKHQIDEKYVFKKDV